MPERRKPQQTPGPALSKLGDFTLPAAMYYDAIYFVEQARRSPESEPWQEKRHLRAALYSAFGFFEAQLNQVAFAHADTHVDALNEIERNVLEEKETVLDERGHLIRKVKFYPLEARFLFLTLFLSGQEFDRTNLLWDRFRRAKALRDSWTHPKPPFDFANLTVVNVEEAIKVLREVLVELSRLMNIEVPLWLLPFERVVIALDSDQESR